MLPTFTDAGLLPKGIHTATWVEFETRFRFSARRVKMLDALSTVLRHFASAGCGRVLIGGSFVTSKMNPNDIDVLWDVEGVDYDLVHPMFLDLEIGVPVQRATIGMDVFPMLLIEAKSGLPFPEFFQLTKDGEPKGIVGIALVTL